MFSRTSSLHLPAKLAHRHCGDHFTGAWFNVPALIILLVLTCILVIGVRESAGPTTPWWPSRLAHSDIRAGRGAGVDTANWHPSANAFRGAHGRPSSSSPTLASIRSQRLRGMPEPAARPAFGIIMTL